MKCFGKQWFTLIGRVSGTDATTTSLVCWRAERGDLLPPSLTQQRPFCSILKVVFLHYSFPSWLCVSLLHDIGLSALFPYLLHFFAAFFGRLFYTVNFINLLSGLPPFLLPRRSSSSSILPVSSSSLLFTCPDKG